MICPSRKSVTVATLIALALPLCIGGCSGDNSEKAQPGEYGTLPDGQHAPVADPDIAPDSYGQPRATVGQ